MNADILNTTESTVPSSKFLHWSSSPKLAGGHT